ncbi:hypothetical protein SAMN05421824_2868 [Hyunsoonleella jejuensis]|uniref:Uncharacterized protein n=1 Tax=Hyunsoonleella jejuensis TaxID=419940 RepID=A0A1H9KY22_9FLAO|nr:hypothetical protein [Hyunsoonleella jejuensis]SER04082.1 hypothetical protein SAMN05421824_2868 [Hyunsoonleella jejuensis]
MWYEESIDFYESAKNSFRVLPKENHTIVAIEKVNHDNIIEFEVYHNTTEEIVIFSYAIDI